MKTKKQLLEQLDTVTEEIGEATVLHLLGRATPSTLDHLESHLRGILAGRPQKVVILGNELLELSAIAVGALVRFQRDVARWDGEVRFVGLPI